MKNLLKYNLPQMMLLVSVLSLSCLSSCRNKINVGEICVSLEETGFWCADQRVPTKQEGYFKAYKPNMICQEADQYNNLIEELSKMQSDIAKYKWGKK